MNQQFVLGKGLPVDQHEGRVHRQSVGDAKVGGHVAMHPLPHLGQHAATGMLLPTPLTQRWDTHKVQGKGITIGSIVHSPSCF